MASVGARLLMPPGRGRTPGQAIADEGRGARRRDALARSERFVDNPVESGRAFPWVKRSWKLDDKERPHLTNAVWLPPAPTTPTL